MARQPTLRTCSKGHQHYKTTDCPTCPVCEKENAPAEGLLSMLGAPARRALEREGITTAKKLSGWREKELLKLHGVGPSSIPKLKEALQQAGLSFKE